MSSDPVIYHMTVQVIADHRVFNYLEITINKFKYYYNYRNIYLLSTGFFSYDGYYYETDRTDTVQKTIPLLKCEASMQHPPPTPMM